MDHLSLPGHQRAPPTVAPPTLEPAIEIIDDHRVTEQGFGERTVAFLDADHVEKPGESVAWTRGGALLPAVPASRFHRDEGASTGAVVLQLSDRVARILGGSYDHVLQPLAEHGCHCLLEFGRGVDHLRDEVENSVRALGMLAHDGTHALVVPLIAALHLLGRAQPRLLFGERRRRHERRVLDRRLLGAKIREGSCDLRRFLPRGRQATFEALALARETGGFGRQTDDLAVGRTDLGGELVATLAAGRGSLLPGTHAVTDLRFGALVLDVLRLRLFDLVTERRHPSFFGLDLGEARRQAPFSLLVLVAEILERSPALVDFRSQLGNAPLGLLAVALDPLELLATFALLAVEHLEARLRSLARGADLEQGALTAAQVGVGGLETTPGGFAFGLEPIDSRREIALARAQRRPSFADGGELGL